MAIASPAQALEKRLVGDAVVRPGETAPEVSTVTGDVRVDGIVEGDVHSAFGDVRVNGGVGGDVNAGFGDVEVRAPVGGRIEAGFGNVYVDAPVRGDVDVRRGSLRLGPKARVSGHVFVGDGEMRGKSDSVVEGDVMLGAGPHLSGSPGLPYQLGPTVRLLAALAFVACAVLAAVLAPRPLSAAARRAEEAPGRSFVLGLVSVPAVVVLSVVLVVSVVGAPLLLLLAPAYLALVFFGALVAAFFVGSKVVMATGRYRAGNDLAAVVGALILIATTLIPLVGNLILYALALLGTGAAILALLSRRRPLATHPSYEAYFRGRRPGQG